MEARERLLKVLEAVVSRDYVSPGDVVVVTGLPRYIVLAFIQCLEALGALEPVYVRGSYKVYRATSLAGRLLNLLKAGAGVGLLEQLEGASVASASSAERVEAEAG